MKTSGQRTTMESFESKGHEKTASSSRPLSERFGLGYIRETFEWFTGKGRKKDKNDGTGDGTTSNADEFQKGYLRFSSMQQFTKNHQLREMIPVPNEVELHEWLASQVIPFFHHVNLLYGAISEFCTSSSCPVMSAPNNIIYHWVDEKGRKSKCSAPQYIDYVTVSIEKLINDESVFPTKYGQSFPPNFEVVLRRIMRQLFHVLAHIYHAHFDPFIQLGIEKNLNGLFAHFILFSRHFNLMEARELEVLRDLVDRIANDSDVILETDGERKVISDTTMNSALSNVESTAAVETDDSVGPVKILCNTRDIELVTTGNFNKSQPLSVASFNQLVTPESASS